jgi:DNA helicase II / ATP-dependent DNA helicase PcrA
LANSTFRICPQRQALLDSDGHLLVLGGPGSGKTAIALVKSGHEIEKGHLASGQKVLFLSFARATIGRVLQESKIRIGPGIRSQLEITTYHAFAWGILRSHGYLLTGHKRTRLLTPPGAAARLAGIPKEKRRETLRRLLAEERLLGFDLFAELVSELFDQCPRLQRVFSDCYPIIVVDEFQDTDRYEWRMIAALGENSRLIALADPDQRIYEFRGADPARIGEFATKMSPQVFDFGQENNRSDGTDIVRYGNDLLTSANRGKNYTHVKVAAYGYYQNEPLQAVKFAAFQSMKRLLATGDNKWSLAILVSSKEMMLKVCSYLSSTSAVAKAIAHEALIDPEGPALAAVLIAGLLEGAATVEQIGSNTLIDLMAHIRGSKGGTISHESLKLAKAVEEYLRNRTIRGKNRLELIANIETLAQARFSLVLTGDPTHDWLQVQRLFSAATHDCLKAVAEDARFIRLLNRGTQLRDNLSAQWRSTSTYFNARALVANALVEEHFSSSIRVWTGVNVMTIHKSKGKEFDEVIIFEGPRIGRLLRENASNKDQEQARLTLRVAVTRARKRTTILTPSWCRCTLL